MKGGNIFVFDIQGDFRFFREIIVILAKTTSKYRFYTFLGEN